MAVAFTPRMKAALLRELWGDEPVLRRIEITLEVNLKEEGHFIELLNALKGDVRQSLAMLSILGDSSPSAKMKAQSPFEKYEIDVMDDADYVPPQETDT